MSNQKIIDFKVTRNFGEKVNATFSYISQNFRSLFLSLLYILGPIMLLTGIVTALFLDWYVGFITDTMNGSGPDFNPEDLSMLLGVGFGLTILGVLAGSLIMAVVYSHMMIYKETRSTDIEISAVWERTKKEFTPLLGAQIGIVVLLVFAFAIIGGILIGLPAAMDMGGLTAIAIFGFFILVIYVSIAISLCFIVKVEEKVDFFTMIQRSFYLIRGKWWSTFGLLFIMSLIAGIMANFFAIPVFFGQMMDTIHTIETGEMPLMEESMSLWDIVFTTLAQMARLLLQALPLIAIAFQYFNLVELKEAAGLMGKIESIGDDTEADDLDEDY